MENLSEIIKTLPDFYSEDWIKVALEKLDKSKMTSEQRMHFEMALAKKGSLIEMREEEDEELTRKNNLKIAIKMKEDKIDSILIVKYTGLTIKEIEAL